MRILHITGEFPPYFMGGLGTYVYEISRGLFSRGHEIDVLLIKGSDRAYKKELVPESGDINVIVRDFDAKSFSKFSDGVFSVDDIENEFDALEGISKRPDVVHIHDWYGVLWGSVIKRHYNVPTIMTAHLPLRSGFTYTGHPISIKVKMRLEALGFRFADVISVPSNFIARVLMNEYNVPTEKIRVIPNGVDTQYFSPQESKNKKEKVVLSVSRITEQKGVGYLPELVQRVTSEIPSTKFLIVGDGAVLSSLERMINSLSISDNVEFLGFISRDRLLEMYRLSDVFVSTSIYEPFGLVILEAMASGKPVAAFSLGGIKEIVRDNIDGFLVPPCRIDLLSESIVKLLSNHQLRSECGNNARKRALEYDWRNVITMLENVYKNGMVRT